jgi:hypothetical protein
MYNDRHWLTDAAVAGIGILCTKTAYWYPKCKNYFSKKNKTSVMTPFGKETGMDY